MDTRHFGTHSDYGLEHHGLYNLRNVYWNLTPPRSVEEALFRSEGQLAHMGALVVNTGYHSGRSPNDKYFVKNDIEDKDIFWNKDNKPISPDYAKQLHQKVIAYLQGRDVFVQDMAVGAHPEHNLPIRVISDQAFAGLFSHDLFIRLPEEQLLHHKPEFTILHCLNLHSDPNMDGTLSSTFIVVNLHERLILIGNTGYAGEIKKSIFTIMNFLMPLKGIMSMHC